MDKTLVSPSLYVLDRKKGTHLYLNSKDSSVHLFSLSSVVFYHEVALNFLRSSLVFVREHLNLRPL